MDKVFSQRAALDRNGFALSMTEGVSMRPLIWGGKHCVAVKPLTDEPQPGDILMFVQSRCGLQKNIVHRVVEIRHQGTEPLYITRGDNCLATEEVRREDIIGKVVEVHRMTGFRPWFVISAKKFTVSDPRYLQYVRLWSTIWPLRRVFYLMRAHAYGLKARLSRLLKKN